MNRVKTSGSQYLCGFPFTVLAKCLQFLVAVRILNDEINYCICYMTNSESNSRYQSDNIFLSIARKMNALQGGIVNNRMINGLVTPI